MGTCTRCVKKSIENSQLFVNKMKKFQINSGGDFFYSGSGVSERAVFYVPTNTV